jgi:hypothetical protein
MNQRAARPATRAGAQERKRRKWMDAHSLKKEIGLRGNTAGVRDAHSMRSAACDLGRGQPCYDDGLKSSGHSCVLDRQVTSPVVAHLFASPGDHGSTK